jgi:DNA-binding XRE family transcriptional regulator
MEYSKILKQIRDKLFLTQQELAVMLGVSFATINRWETRKNNPSIKCKKKIVELAKKVKIEF